MTIEDNVEQRLDRRYRDLQIARAPFPVYAIEHGLTVREVEEGTVALTARLQRGNFNFNKPSLALMAVASEVGYNFEGLWSGYWPRLEALLRTPLDAADREAISAMFKEACQHYGLAAPDDTAFSRHFRHIAWPLANAVAPRQIHAGLAEALLSASVLDPDDDEFLHLVRQGCSRTGAPRLIEWAGDSDRLTAVSKALLKRPDGRLSEEFVQRLSADAVAAPGAKERLHRARKAVTRSKTHSRIEMRLSLSGEDGDLILGATRWPPTPADGPRIPPGGFTSLDEATGWAKANRYRFGIALDNEPLLFANVSFMPVDTWVAVDVEKDQLPGGEIRALCAEALPDDASPRCLGTVAGLTCYAIDRNEHDIGDFFSDLVSPGDGLRIEGGLPLDLGGRYASGVPLTVTRAGAALHLVVKSEDTAPTTVSVPADTTVTLSPRRAAQVILHGDDGMRLTPVLVFEDAEAEPPLISVASRPAMPTVTDLREGRITIDLRSMRPLLDVPVRLTLRLTGHPDREFVETLSCVPGRLDGGTAAFGAMNAVIEEMPLTPVSAIIDVDIGVDTHRLQFQEPEKVVLWSEDEQGWRGSHAGDTDDEEEKPVVVRAVPAAEPLAQSQDYDPAKSETQLLLAEGADPGHGLVTAPRRRKGLTAPDRPAPALHRKMARTPMAPGLLAEITAWLEWSCAESEHLIARFEAREAAKTAKCAIVSTLCGTAWLAAEGKISPGTFSDRLVQFAIGRDLVKAAELREIGIEIDQADMAELREKLTRILTESCDDLLAIPDEIALTDEVAGRLDQSVDSAWDAIAENRLRRGKSPLDPDTGNAAAEWGKVWLLALEQEELPGLAALLLPARLGHELRQFSYFLAEPVDIAEAIAGARVDLGLAARRGRSLTADDIASCLTLWTNPRIFARLDWRPLAARLLEDRMTARAVRYVALRMHGGGLR